MKNILLILFCIIFYGCKTSNSFCLKQSVTIWYGDNQTDKTFTRITYRQNGNKEKKVSYRNGILQVVDTFNDQGNVLNREYFNNDGSLHSERYRSYFDDNSIRTEHYITYDKDSSIERVFKTKFLQNRMPLYVLDSSRHGLFDSWHKYKYNEEGHLTEFIDFIVKKQNNQIDTFAHAIFKNNGDLISYRDKSHINTREAILNNKNRVWSREIIVAYDENGNLVEINSSESYEDPMEGSLEKLVYKYDSEERLIEYNAYEKPEEGVGELNQFSFANLSYYPTGKLKRYQDENDIYELKFAGDTLIIIDQSNDQTNTTFQFTVEGRLTVEKFDSSRKLCMKKVMDGEFHYDEIEKYFKDRFSLIPRIDTTKFMDCLEGGIEISLYPYLFYNKHSFSSFMEFLLIKCKARILKMVDFKPFITNISQSENTLQYNEEGQIKRTVVKWDSNYRKITLFEYIDSLVIERDTLLTFPPLKGQMKLIQDNVNYGIECIELRVGLATKINELQSSFSKRIMFNENKSIYDKIIYKDYNSNWQMIKDSILNQGVDLFQYSDDGKLAGIQKIRYGKEIYYKYLDYNHCGDILKKEEYQKKKVVYEYKYFDN